MLNGLLREEVWFINMGGSLRTKETRIYFSCS